MVCQVIIAVYYEETYEQEVLEEAVKVYTLTVDDQAVCTIPESESSFVIAASHNEEEGKLMTRCC